VEDLSETEVVGSYSNNTAVEINQLKGPSLETRKQNIHPSVVIFS